MLPSENSSLENWLDYISSVHPREIELGLKRIRQVASRLLPNKLASHVITVAGTNGKGSSVAAMESILEASGHKTGAFTSPHIHKFNERIRIRAQEQQDRTLVEGFVAIEACRQGVSLSYFEYSTLLAFYLFAKAELDVVLLEVGLGGRLDAVNLIDADIALISSISLDHEDWLGSDLDVIAAEKAGIMRPGKPTVIAHSSPSKSIKKRAKELSSKLYVLGREFKISKDPEGVNCWSGQSASGKVVSLTGVENPCLYPANIAAALQAVSLLPLTLDQEKLRAALKSLRLGGRFELRRDRASSCTVLLDVAHNPAAAELLAENLKALQTPSNRFKSTAVVLAVMADKDIDGMLSALESCSDIWYIAQVDEGRCLAVSELQKLMQNRPFFQLGTGHLESFDTVTEAYSKACADCVDQGLVVVTGSFSTVSAIREQTDAC